jgi:ribosomal protein L11 methyltransferase
MPASWLRVTVKSPSAEQADLLGEGLVACGGGAVEERDGSLITYLPLADGADAAAEAERLREALGQHLGAEPPHLVCDDVPEQDWLALWRSGLGPRRVGERLVIAPTWSEVRTEPHELLIRIDPQMAFGTGEHASTRGVLRLMQRVVQPGACVLDVGAGSAILAIAAAKLGAAHVTAVESDGEAMENAAGNIAGNDAGERVSLACDLVDEAFLRDLGAGALNGILANVLSGVLRPLLPAFHRSLAAGGWAILSGILLEEAAAMRTAAALSGFSVEAEDTEEQWWSVLLRRVEP